MTWLYNGRPVSDKDTDGFVAFVYVIEHTKTGRKYFGKKRLRKKVSKKPLKGKKRRRISYKESDWKDYWGSNEALQKEVAEQGPKSFTRTILRLCKTLSESSYYEAKIQFVEDVLLQPGKFYNEWISVRLRATHFK
jgi:hypothetical protein